MPPRAASPIGERVRKRRRGMGEDDVADNAIAEPTSTIPQSVPVLPSIDQDTPTPPSTPPFLHGELSSAPSTPATSTDGSTLPTPQDSPAGQGIRENVSQKQSLAGMNTIAAIAGLQTPPIPTGFSLQRDVVGPQLTQPATSSGTSGTGPDTVATSEQTPTATSTAPPTAVVVPNLPAPPAVAAVPAAAVPAAAVPAAAVPAAAFHAPLLPPLTLAPAPATATQVHPPPVAFQAQLPMALAQAQGNPPLPPAGVIGLAPAGPQVLPGFEDIPIAVQQLALQITGTSLPNQHIYSVTQLPLRLDWGRGRMERRLCEPGNTPTFLRFTGRVRTSWFFDRSGKPQSRVNVGLHLLLDTEEAAIQTLYRKAQPPAAPTYHDAYSHQRLQVLPFKNVFDARDGVLAKTEDRRLNAVDFTDNDVIAVDAEFTRWRKTRATTWSEFTVGFELSTIYLLWDST
ncbi:hypothetical protein OH76DRAFT_1414566 [Lentinus brumalis]|uniref:Uncharacterized protein n=1 Tax=Lentinus brumalis TaxID=2498619 RepID=A0A371DUF3_9APHY|nr:hypothetical protein OH76DRAFT_1414566 [Polyporus brumalis]